MYLTINNPENRLKCIKTKGKTVRGYFPDFLLVGPQRTGSSWVHDKLSKHPEIYMSYPKENFFFSRLSTGNNRHSKYYEKVFNQKVKFKRAYLNAIAKLIRIDLLQTSLMNATYLEWYLSFFNDNRATSILNSIKFKDYRKDKSHYKLLGDATASNFTLNKEIIQDIIELNPAVKVIILIRNPVSRTWSHAKKDLLSASSNHISDHAFKSFFNQPYIRECNSYAYHIDKWKSILGLGQIFVGFYDDLVDSPDLFLKSILAFLNVSTDLTFIKEDLFGKVMSTKRFEIPDETLKYLADLYCKEIEELEIRYPGKIKY